MNRAGILAAASLLTLAATIEGRAQQRTVWDGVYTDEQATRGEALYGEHCVRCHGASLQGNGEGAKPLTDATFKSTWNGVPLGAMFDRVRLSMPQDKPGDDDATAGRRSARVHSSGEQVSGGEDRAGASDGLAERDRVSGGKVSHFFTYFFSAFGPTSAP